MDKFVKYTISPNTPLCSPKIFIISAPSGAGKTTLVNLLKEEFPHSVSETISFTTRKPRDDELDGRDYHFVSKKEFQERIERDFFLEWEFLFGEYYGTGNIEIQNIIDSQKHAIVVIDVDGAINISSIMNCVKIFISPPSDHELKMRLVKRGSDSEGSIQSRIERSAIEKEKDKYFHYNIINNDMNDAYQVLKSIFIAEEHRKIVYGKEKSLNK